ncbi:MAG: type II secretion system secretin GspD [Marinobacterium sp.]|nr:type II secretion system secretin GspD [Marinobacterium sp.]
MRDAVLPGLKTALGGAGLSLTLSLTLLLTLLLTPTLSAAADSATDGAADTDNRFTLDMRGADIREFIKTISRLTSTNIVIDQKVRGKVDIQSPHPLTHEELLEIFRAQLSVNGFTVIDTGTNILKVVPIHAARVEGVDLKGDGLTPGEKIISRVVPVKNVDANQLVATLRPLVDTKVGTITGYNTSNVILITDRASNVVRLTRIIDSVDKADPQSLELIPLKNASASEMQRTLRDLTNRRSKNQGSRQTLIAVDNRTNTLIIRADDATRRRFRDLVTQLDASIESSNNTRVVYLKYAKAENLVKVLKSVSDAILQEEKQKAGGKTKQTQRSNINIEGHEATNSLVMSGSPHIIRALEAVIRKLDIRRAQVLVEAIVVEISDDRARQLGIQWMFGHNLDSSNPVGSAINFSRNGPTITDLLNNSDEALGKLPDGVNIGFGKLNRDGFSFAALLQALGTDTDSNVLSTPSLLTMDNEEASIHVGREVPVITGSTAGDNNGNPFQTIERQDIGVKLKVTPQINEGDAVALAIEQEVSSLSGLSASDIITNKRVVQTRVLVDNGATIVLGGLIDEDIQESTSKVPVLGDLPLVGRAFRADSSKRVKRNLMVFIRPTIVRDLNGISSISREKYNYIYQHQRDTRSEGINLLPERHATLLPQWQPQQPSPDSLTRAEEAFSFPDGGR